MFLRPNWQEMGSGVCARATFARAAAAMPPNRHDTKPRRWSSAKMFHRVPPRRRRLLNEISDRADPLAPVFDLAALVQGVITSEAAINMRAHNKSEQRMFAPLARHAVA